MEDQSGKGRSFVGKRDSITGADLSKSLLTNYKKDDKDFFEKQKLAELQKQQAEYLLQEQQDELNEINEQLEFEPHWDALTWRDKARLFRYWSIFNFFGNII